jgi:hypothetical protein
MLRQFQHLRRRYSWLVMALALAFAAAPAVVNAVMTLSTSGSSNGLTSPAKPCPQHMGDSAGDHEGSGHAERAADQTPHQCYCGLLCHAAFATVVVAVPAAPSGLQVTGAGIIRLPDGIWPAPMPRPPQA